MASYRKKGSRKGSRKTKKTLGRRVSRRRGGSGLAKHISPPSIEGRCYTVVGKGFKSLRVLGKSNRDKLIKSLKKKKLSARSYQLNHRLYNSKNCKKNPKVIYKK